MLLGRIPELARLEKLGVELLLGGIKLLGLRGTILEILLRRGILRLLYGLGIPETLRLCRIRGLLLSERGFLILANRGINGLAPL